MNEPRRQLRWWLPGGFRSPILARVTNGRIGMGRWKQEEIDKLWIDVRAEVQALDDLTF